MQISFSISHEGLTTLKMHYEDGMLKIKLDELKIVTSIVLSENEETLHRLEEILA